VLNIRRVLLNTRTIAVKLEGETCISLTETADMKSKWAVGVRLNCQKESCGSRLLPPSLGAKFSSV
jgi:hypothetical protein